MQRQMAICTLQGLYKLQPSKMRTLHARTYWPLISCKGMLCTSQLATSFKIYCQTELTCGSLSPYNTTLQSSSSLSHFTSYLYSTQPFEDLLDTPDAKIAMVEPLELSLRISTSLHHSITVIPTIHLVPCGRLLAFWIIKARFPLCSIYDQRQGWRRIILRS